MNPNKLVRQSFSLSKEESEALEEFANKTNCSRSEIIRKCIQGELLLKKVIDQGGKIIVMTEDDDLKYYDPYTFDLE